MNHLQLYHDTSLECGKLITRRYSTSFSLGIQMLGKEIRGPIYAIYAFVRLADEIVDTFHGHDKETLLREFRRDTYLALERKISVNPVLHSFQETVHQFGIEIDLVDAFLDSMEMDLTGKTYDDSLYRKYIYGSAEVVGLMCLRVFCYGDATYYERLKAPARSLGAAFQKVNFLRDLKDDFDGRGRMYFPGVDFSRFSEADKRQIEEDIHRDFEDALAGIKQLPAGSRKGVYLAYRYYVKLFRKITVRPPEQIKTERIRINNAAKMYILAKSFARYRLNLF
jgi:phytoene/squalene synthetase